MTDPRTTPSTPSAIPPPPPVPPVPAFLLGTPGDAVADAPELRDLAPASARAAGRGRRRRVLLTAVVAVVAVAGLAAALAGPDAALVGTAGDRAAAAAGAAGAEGFDAAGGGAIGLDAAGGLAADGTTSTTTGTGGAGAAQGTDDDEPLAPGTPGLITGSGSPGGPPAPATIPPPVELPIVEPFAPAAPPAPTSDISPVDLLQFPAAGPIDDIVSNQPGCTRKCLTTAVVHRNNLNTRLRLETETSVAALVKVYVSTDTPTVTGGVPWFPNTAPVATSGSHGSSWSHTITGLDADTTYHVIVKATDLQGRSQYVTGPVRTPALADQLVAPGDGCTFQCITSGYAHLTHRFDVVNFGFETSTPVDLTVAVSTQEPGWIGGSPILPADVPVEVPGGWHQSWRLTASDLAPSTTYHVVARATDPQGRHSSRVGRFTTAPEPPAIVEITLERVHIIYDGDASPGNAGEIEVAWSLADGQVTGRREHDKVHDGTTLDIDAHNKVYVPLERGKLLAPMLVNVIEDDYDMHTACRRQIIPMATEAFYHLDCDAHISAAQTGLISLDSIEAMSGCAAFGMPVHLDPDKCTVIVTPELTDGFARFYAVLSFRIL